jgi:flagellar protein FlhE
MRNKFMSLKKRCAVLGAVSTLALVSQPSVAGSYHSTVGLPTIHSKGHVYRTHVPVTGIAQPGSRMSTVSWTWNYVGFPRGLVVQLCQGTVNKCHDVSRQRSGSTSWFGGNNPSQAFFFRTMVVNNRNSSPVPIGAQGAAVTVSW